MSRRAPRQTLLALCWGLLLVAGWCRVARAQLPFELRVERGPDAESCPDPETLRARVAVLRGPRQSGVRGSYRVEFARDGASFASTIHTQPGPDAPAGVRVLRAPGDSCAGLAEATAVTLALLLDAEPPEPEPEPEPLPAVVEKPVPPPPPSLAPEPDRPRVLLSFGGARAYGLLRASLPALLFEAGVELKTVRIMLGALWSWPETEDFGPGKLRESLRSGSARVCLPVLPGRYVHVDVCSGAFVGVFDVRASHFTSDSHKRHLWLAAPLDLSLSLGSRRVWGELSAGALFSAHRPDVSVTGIGTAYQSWPVSPMVALRLFGGVPR